MNAIKQSFFIYIFLSISIATTAQTIVKGYCKDYLGHPIRFASIVAKDSIDVNTWGFTFTDSMGYYECRFETSIDSVYITLSHINYTGVAQKIKNQTQTFDFFNVTAEKSQILKEVFVETPPISIRGDTTNYLPDKFKSARDRTLEDILKKMPGVEVDPSGKIKYQGKYLNKFYVEGKDMMEGNYNLLSKALPVGDVKVVQILSNHQPINILKNKVFSPSPAMNIKLKSRVSATGRAKIGVGYSPFLRDIAITPMLFTKNHQMLFDMKSNNVGANLYTKQDNEISFNDYEGTMISSSPVRLISVAEPETPTLDERRYLNNNDHALSANYLLGLGKFWQVKTNANTLKVATKKLGFRKATVHLPDGSMAMYERVFDNSTSNKLFKVTNTIVNNSDKLFLRNTFLYKTETERNLGVVRINKAPVYQNLESPFQSIQNSFSTIIPVFKKKKLLNVMSSFSKNNSSQAYYLQPLKALSFIEKDLIQFDSLLQNIKLDNFVLSNSIFISFGIGKILIRPRIEQIITQSALKTNLMGNESVNFKPDEWSNNQIFRSSKILGGINVDYNTSKVKLKLGVPITNYNAALTNDTIIKKYSKAIFEPEATIWLKVKNFYSLSIGGERKLSFPTVNNFYDKYILNALDIYKNDINILPSVQQSIYSGIEYKNPISNLFMNTRYSYAKTLNYQVLQLHLGNNGQNSYQNINKKNN